MPRKIDITSNRPATHSYKPFLHSVMPSQNASTGTPIGKKNTLLSSRSSFQGKRTYHQHVHSSECKVIYTICRKCLLLFQNTHICLTFSAARKLFFFFIKCSFFSLLEWEIQNLFTNERTPLHYIALHLFQFS